MKRHSKTFSVCVLVFLVMIGRTAVRGDQQHVRLHWPVAQVPSGGRYASASDRPAHSCVSTQQSKPLSFTKQRVTHVMLCGLVDGNAGDLVPLAKSWGQAPTLKLNPATAENLSYGYDVTERAYRMRLEPGVRPVSIDFEIQASTQSPLLNPAFILCDWGQQNAAVILNGAELREGKEFRFGHRKRIEGTDLVLWIRRSSTTPIHMSIRPALSK